MRLSVVLLATLATFAAPTVEAAMVEKIKVGNWEGGAYTDDNTNSFLSCTVGTTFANGTYFNISVFASGGTGIGIFAPSLKLQVGEPITGTLKIDDRYFSSFEGRALSDTGVSIAFAETDPIFEALRRGKLLTLTSRFGIVYYDLTDTAKALTELKRCVDKYRPFARVNTAYAAWIARSKWFNDPTYSSFREAAVRINSELVAEGRDSFSQEFYDELDKRLLALLSPESKDGGRATTTMGTGIVVSATGEVLTNLHVIKNCVSPIEVRGSSGVTSSTTVLLVDSQNDLALIATPYRTARLPRIRETPIENGESVAVIGFPLGTYDLNITEGIVSSLAGRGDSTMMTISAPANHGNSGGPVLDTSGSIVGVLTAGESEAQNTNFAIKNSAVREFLSRRTSYVPPRKQSTAKMTFPELVDYADSFTVRLLCVSESKAE